MELRVYIHIVAVCDTSVRFHGTYLMLIVEACISCGRIMAGGRRISREIRRTLRSTPQHLVTCDGTVKAVTVL